VIQNFSEPLHDRKAQSEQRVDQREADATSQEAGVSARLAAASGGRH